MVFLNSHRKNASMDRNFFSTNDLFWFPQPNSEPTQADKGGRRPAHDRADSSCAARRNSVASSPNRPTKWTPTGSPSAFQYRGTDIAGCPLALQMGVNGTKVSARRRPWRGFSGGESKVPRGTGGSLRVGVSQRSYLRKNRAIFRATL